MIVCIDTNVLVQLFGAKFPYPEIKAALAGGRIALAISTDILLEYEEVINRLGSTRRWQAVSVWLESLSALHGNVRRHDPQFRFRVITNDPDDNKFVDCAIAAEADFIVTEDTDFAALRLAGYKTQPIAPKKFISRHLAQSD